MFLLSIPFQPGGNTQIAPQLMVVNVDKIAAIFPVELPSAIEGISKPFCAINLEGIPGQVVCPLPIEDLTGMLAAASELLYSNEQRN